MALFWRFSDLVNALLKPIDARYVLFLFPNLTRMINLGVSQQTQKQVAEQTNQLLNTFSVAGIIIMELICHIESTNLHLASPEETTVVFKYQDCRKEPVHNRPPHMLFCIVTLSMYSQVFVCWKWFTYFLCFWTLTKKPKKPSKTGFQINLKIVTKAIS